MAIGVFAANEANDGDPNLTCIGVSLPNPLNDDGELMVYVLFANRKISAGKFGTLDMHTYVTAQSTRGATTPTKGGP